MHNRDQSDSEKERLCKPGKGCRKARGRGFELANEWRCRQQEACWGTLNGPVSTQSLRDHEVAAICKTGRSHGQEASSTQLPSICCACGLGRDRWRKSTLSLYPLSDLLDMDKLSTFSFTMAQKQRVFSIR